MFTIDGWFIKNAFRPITILALSLYVLLAISIVMFYFNSKADNEIFINQSAKHLHLAINQKNRSQVDLIISTLAKLETVRAVSLCDGNDIVMTRKGGKDFCKSMRLKSIADVPILGSETFFLRVQFKNIFFSPGLLIGFLLSILGACLGFCIIFRLKKRFKVDLLDRLKNIGDLINVDNMSPIIELRDISNDIHEAQENKVRIQSQKVLMDLSRQVSHDIRSPLATLNFIIENQKNITDLDRKIIYKSLNRINTIADDLLFEAKSNNAADAKPSSIRDYDIVQLISDVVQEKRIEFKKIDLISIDLNLQITSALVSDNVAKDLSRVISNLINNSVEAMGSKGNVNIFVYQKNDDLYIEIGDEGGGVSEDVLKNLGKINLTTKNHGNGLGVAHAVKVVKEFGGQIYFENARNGLSVTIVIRNNKSIDAVLIDNDELCRTMWEMKALSKGLRILTFSSPTAFLDIKNTINTSTPIYLDSQLDDGIRGEMFASSLYDEGYSNLFMTTGHPVKMFDDYSFLSGVISKSPPF